jgi:hypothetical protein
MAATLNGVRAEVARHSIAAQSRRLLPGDLVEVRAWEDIRSTLDDRGCAAGLPFMPEMVRHCGRRFLVWRRVEKTCVEGDRMRRLEHVVYLEDLRCDGSGHDGCEKECRFFWHEAWLRPVDDAGVAPVVVPAQATQSVFPYPTTTAPGRYRCQSTELLGATRRLSKLDPRQYLRDLRDGTWSPRQMAWFLWSAFVYRVRAVLAGRRAPLQSDARQTISQALDLRPGELVEVKSGAEIAATLDRRGRNRGLEFTVYMLPFVGGRFLVRRPVRRIILETTGEMRELQHTVTLENSTCDGCVRWGGCPRDVFHFWREVWLKRVEPGPGTCGYHHGTPGVQP